MSNERVLLSDLGSKDSSVIKVSIICVVVDPCFLQKLGKEVITESFGKQFQKLKEAKNTRISLLIWKSDPEMKTVNTERLLFEIASENLIT